MSDFEEWLAKHYPAKYPEMAVTKYGLIVRLKSIATQLKNTGCDLDYYGGFRHGHNGLKLIMISQIITNIAKRLEEDE